MRNQPHLESMSARARSTRLQIFCGMLAKEPPNFVKTECGPDTSRFAQRRSRLCLAIEFQKDPGNDDTSRVQAAIAACRGRRLRQCFLKTTSASERVGKYHAPEGQSKILWTRSHAELHTLNAFIEATKENERRTERHVRLCVARIENERASQQLDAALMFSDVGKSAASESENIGSIRVYGDCAARPHRARSF